MQPPDQQAVIASLTQCTEEELVGKLADFKEWKLDKVRC